MVSEETEVLEVREDLLHGLPRVLGLLAAGDDQLAGPEEEDHDLRVLEPVYKAGELLGLILDPVKVEPDGDLVQVDAEPRSAEVTMFWIL